MCVFLSNPQTTFEKLIEPYFKQTAQEIYANPVVLAVGDTSFLDYKQILSKREDYGPTGNGGNVLILHTALAVDPDSGQPLGLLWEKLWNRDKKAQPKEGETPEEKKKRLADERKAKKNKAFEKKESYRWVEAFQQVENLFSNLETLDGLQPKVIHIFDREGDIALVFEQACEMKNIGVVVRAAHNRCLQDETLHLWQYVASQPVEFVLEVTLCETKKRTAANCYFRSQILSGQIACPLKVEKSRWL